MKVFPPAPSTTQESVRQDNMTTHRFWPLDYNPEDEIYEGVC